MKYVKESLSEFNSTLYGKINEKEDPKIEKDKKVKDDEEKEGMDVIKKLQDNFKRFKSAAGNKILKYKEFWEENQKCSENFDESGEIYKMWDSNYAAGVLNLPDPALSDDELNKEIDLVDREKKDDNEELGLDEAWRPKGEKFLFEKKEEPKLGFDLGGDEEKDDEKKSDKKDKKMSKSEFEEELEEKPEDESDEFGEESDKDLQSDEFGLDSDSDLSFGDEGEASENFALFDLGGSEREEIFRTKNPKVIQSFKDFFENTFKAAIKEQIRIFKEAQQEKEAEEKAKAQEELKKKRKGKLDKFMKESHWDRYAEHLKTKYPNWNWKNYEEPEPDVELEDEDEEREVEMA